jgi:hypothetical protein
LSAKAKDSFIQSERIATATTEPLKNYKAHHTKERHQPIDDKWSSLCTKIVLFAQRNYQRLFGLQIQHMFLSYLRRVHKNYDYHSYQVSTTMDENHQVVSAAPSILTWHVAIEGLPSKFPTKNVSL